MAGPISRFSVLNIYVLILWIGTLATSQPVSLEKWEGYYQATVSIYMERFGKLPTSLEEISRAGYLYMEPVNPLTGQPIKNVCDSPSPGDYCMQLSPDGEKITELTLWSANGKKISSLGDHPLDIPWGKGNPSPVSPFARALKAGYDEEEMKLVGYGQLLMRKWMRAYCREGLRHPEEFLKFLEEPYTMMKDPLEGKNPLELWENKRLKLWAQFDRRVLFSLHFPKGKAIYKVSYNPVDKMMPCHAHYILPPKAEKQKPDNLLNRLP